MSLPLIQAKDLDLELLDPGSTPLVRLFRHPGGKWEPPPEVHRNLRVDPPAGHKGAFAVLYTGNTLATVAIECGVLRADVRDRYTWAADLAEQYRVVRYTFVAPALFVPIDGPNREALGLAGSQRKFVAGYEPYQLVAHELFQRYGNVVHGLSWESFQLQHHLARGVALHPLVCQRRAGDIAAQEPDLRPVGFDRALLGRVFLQHGRRIDVIACDARLRR